ncbi:RNA recognition motif-containing protein [Actinomortierella ambigua]|uniref:RNA recognition motif-containing protein n=1 Tax=Actinomortierella ambigua TaxID=1343610 RepID=A0A9P6QBM1_9FUNG|nr:RNA recognition motif-containing protein [Actinomortierella ambigua]
MSDSIEATEPSTASAPAPVVDNKYSKSTLFVRGLPFEATSAQLEAFFGEIGPVRSCFVVLDKSAEQAAAESEDGEKKGIAAAAPKAVKNKGFGFVQFVLPDDADRAIEELRTVKFLKQRPLVMEKALKKAANDGDQKAKGEGQPRPAADKPKKQKDQKPKQKKEQEEDVEPKEKNYTFQTVILKGIGKDVTKKHIYKRVRKVGDVKEVIYPISTKDEATNEDKVDEGTAHIIYGSAQLANQAVKQLDGHIFKGGALHATMLATPSVYKRCRLIVRNLPWKLRETELKELFGKYGVVQDVHLPRKYDGGPLRGFGFVQMVSLDEAEKAITNLNGTEHHGRAIAVDWALSKDRFEEAEANASEAPAPEGAEGDVEMKETEQQQHEEDAEMEDAQQEEDDEEGSDDAGDDEDEAEVELNLDHHRNSEDDDDEADSEAEDEDEQAEDDDDLEADLAALDAEEEREKQEKNALPDPSEGTTLFVRNLDFEATKDDLFELFRHWGKLRYCRVTMDHEMGRSRGTGFVCYYNKGAADNCMVDAERVQKIVQPIQQENDRRKKNNFVKATLLAPDLPEELAVKFTLNGRVLNVVRAVDRKAAEDLTAAGQHKREREDRRNLYLMREGVIFPDSPAAAKITAPELSKRQASYAARRQLLARNPSLYISKTRLSIRNLPLKLDEKELRKLGVAAIQKFKNEVKAGKRGHLSAEEQAEGWDKKVLVKQAKVVRSKDRVDGATQQLRSKGYGFLEYAHHAHALAGLRWLNNNPTLFGEKKCLIVEFSVENVVVNRHREDRKKNAGIKRKRGDDAQEDEHRDDNGGDDDENQSNDKKRPRRSIHEGGGGRDRDQQAGRGGRGGRGGGRGGRGRDGHGQGGDRDASKRGGHGGARGGGRGGFGNARGGRGGRGGFGGARGGRGGGRGGFGGRGGSRGGRGGARGGRGGARGGRGGHQ